ncbi:MAG: hypothetical protein ACLTDF_07715 [Coprococcus sp.]
MKNMLRVAAVTPKVHIGSVSGNVREIMDIYEEYRCRDFSDAELSIRDIMCDLFENRKLIDGARRGLLQLPYTCQSVGTGDSVCIWWTEVVQLCRFAGGRVGHR